MNLLRRRAAFTASLQWGCAGDGRWWLTAFLLCHRPGREPQLGTRFVSSRLTHTHSEEPSRLAYKTMLGLKFIHTVFENCTSMHLTFRNESEGERSGDCRAGVSWWSHFKTVEFWEGSWAAALTVGFRSCGPVHILLCQTHTTLWLLTPKSIWTFKPHLKMSACH